MGLSSTQLQSSSVNMLKLYKPFLSKLTGASIHTWLVSARPETAVLDTTAIIDIKKYINDLTRHKAPPVLTINMAISLSDALPTSIILQYTSITAAENIGAVEDPLSESNIANHLYQQNLDKCTYRINYYSIENCLIGHEKICTQVISSRNLKFTSYFTSILWFLENKSTSLHFIQP